MFSSHVVAYIVRFESRFETFETRKSEIIRPRYQQFNACGGSCPSLPCLWQCYLFIHSSELEFPNLNLFIPCRRLYRKLWVKLLNSKIRYHTATLWGFYCMWWLMSLTMYFFKQHYLTFSFTPLSSVFGFLDFSIPYRSLYCKLWFKLLNSKIRYHTATLWAF